MAKPKPRVFIHTNERQWLGGLGLALLADAQRAHADRFDVEILSSGDHLFLRDRDGQVYQRKASA